MRKNKITYLVAFLFLAIGISSCSSSSKHIPDFTGVYKGVIEEPEFLFWNNAAKVYLRKNSNDPYRLSLKTNIYTQNEDPVTLLFKNVIVDAKTATDDSFKFTGKEQNVDFGMYGKADVEIFGKSEDKILTINYELKFGHKEVKYTATFLGAKLNKKESSEALVTKFTIDNNYVTNITIDHTTQLIEVSVNKEASAETVKQFKLNIKVSEGARYTMNPLYLDPLSKTKIKVVSEDESTEKEYTAIVNWVLVNTPKPEA